MYLIARENHRKDWLVHVKKTANWWGKQRITLSLFGISPPQPPKSLQILEVLSFQTKEPQLADCKILITTIRCIN
uniref:SFRICE_021457 n=1 Tax=Spodoptera frugiperda TaxID=7108 RepID=A0A2H1VIB9_SPOFR